MSDFKMKLIDLLDQYEDLRSNFVEWSAEKSYFMNRGDLNKAPMNAHEITKLKIIQKEIHARGNILADKKLRIVSKINELLNCKEIKHILIAGHYCKSIELGRHIILAKINQKTLRVNFQRVLQKVEIV